MGEGNICGFSLEGKLTLSTGLVFEIIAPNRGGHFLKKMSCNFTSIGIDDAFHLVSICFIYIANIMSEKKKPSGSFYRKRKLEESMNTVKPVKTIKSFFISSSSSQLRIDEISNQDVVPTTGHVEEDIIENVSILFKITLSYCLLYIQ